jgi:hypothetical protein
MGAFNSVIDPEQDYRRQLLAEARKGKATAREELQREYHVRMYSAAERAKLYYKTSPKTKKARYKTAAQ